MNDNTALWWVIKGPVVGSIMVSILGQGWGRDRGLDRRQEKGTDTEATGSERWLSPFSWLHYIWQHGDTSYVASPLVLDIYIFSFFPHNEKMLLGAILCIVLNMSISLD